MAVVVVVVVFGFEIKPPAPPDQIERIHMVDMQILHASRRVSLESSI